MKHSNPSCPIVLDYADHPLMCGELERTALATTEHWKQGHAPIFLPAGSCDRCILQLARAHVGSFEKELGYYIKEN